MSQSDLGRRLGVSFQQIQKYEKGMNRVGAGRLPLIAKIFGIPVGALFDANTVTSSGESTRPAPVKLIPDRNTLKLLTAFGDIAQGKIRHSLVGLVNAIAKAAPKAPDSEPGPQRSKRTTSIPMTFAAAGVPARASPARDDGRSFIHDRLSLSTDRQSGLGPGLRMIPF